MIECVLNISEGRDHARLSSLAEACPRTLANVHTDAHHHRSVFTLVGSAQAVEAEARALTQAAVETLDLRKHKGVHPRLGVVDVVPFVPLSEAEWPVCLVARNSFGDWLAQQLQVPSFLYGPDRTLPDVRRLAFRSLVPNFGPSTPHPTAGATAVGVRPVLVAYNVWFDTSDVARIREIARTVRTPLTRTLGLPIGDKAQVSCNLLEPLVEGPGITYQRIAEAARPFDLSPLRAELVGLVPQAVLDAEPPELWEQLDLAPQNTIELALSTR